VSHSAGAVLTGPRAASYAATALARAAARIAAAPVDSRHSTALGEAWSLGRLVAAGLLGEGEVRVVVDTALQRAGKPPGEGDAVARWAITHRAGGAA
jgi:hypothetical protein